MKFSQEILATFTVLWFVAARAAVWQVCAVATELHTHAQPQQFNSTVSLKMLGISVSKFGAPEVLKLCKDIAVPKPGLREVTVIHYYKAHT